MLIDSFYNGLEIHREDKIIYGKFLRPHTVISTCRAAGGVQTDLEYIYNHQGCEPAGHSHGHDIKIWRDPELFRKMTCRRYGLPDEKCATLGTAANMNNGAFVRETFRDLVVGVVCTGGVEVNAGRAGDPASMMETANGFEKVSPEAVGTEENSKPEGESTPTPTSMTDPKPGTINTMIFINKPLTMGALTRVIMTATEAKTAALQELAVNSRYSDGPATGTGTDQIAVAAMAGDDPSLTSAGKHAKLGELIGKAVKSAVKETLGIQNSLRPGGQCSAKIHLERFGDDFRLTSDEMLEMICSFLDSPSESTAPDAAACNSVNSASDLLRQNFSVIERDPVTVAAVAAMVHLKDKFAWGLLPSSCWSEVMGAYAAQVACAVSGDYSTMAAYREQLAPTCSQNDNTLFIKLVCRAFAMGFTDKWKKPEV